MESNHLGRMRLAIAGGFLTCLVAGPAMASPAGEATARPSPNPVPGHMLSPGPTPRSPVPAPIPREVDVLDLIAGHGRPAVRARAADDVRHAQRATPSRTRSVRLTLAGRSQFARSLVYSAAGALVIALVGLVGLGLRRRLW